MDVKALLEYLLRYKWVLIIVPAVALAATYFLIKDLPKQYNSTAVVGIEPGVASQFFSAGQFNQGLGQQLYRIREQMQMKRELDMLSYKLLIHDLENPAQPFKPYSDEIAKWSSDQRALIIANCKDRLLQRSALTKSDSVIYRAVKSMDYDDKSLSGQLDLEVRDPSDYIYISFKSENPNLSSYVVNTLCSDFIFQYNSSNASDNIRSLALLDSIVREKRALMNAKNAQLASYSSSTGIGGRAGSQSDILYQQILSNESRAADVRREIASLRGAIARISGKLNNPDDRDVVNHSSAQNNELLRLEGQLQAANRRYVDNGFKPEDRRIVDSLQKLRSDRAAMYAGTTLPNSQANRQSLISERMGLETKLALAESSVSSIENEITTLRSRFSQMMPADAGVQSLMREADFATKEYTDALNRYSQASMIKNVALQLTMIEFGFNGEAEPGKKVIYLALSGVASFSICCVILIIIFLLDRRIMTVDQLKYATGREPLGIINYIREESKDLRDIWSDENDIPDYVLYKNFVRSVRFEIDKEIRENGQKVFGITSLKFGEGKTFVASSLAYGLALTGKRVLLIAEDAPDLLSLISNKTEHEAQPFETFIVKKQIRAEDRITVLSKNSSQSSLLELKDVQSLVAGFDILKNEFDVVIIDIDSLENFNKAKEWLMFTERSIGVFSVGGVIQGQDKQRLQYLMAHPGFMGWIVNKLS